MAAWLIRVRATGDSPYRGAEVTEEKEFKLSSFATLGAHPDNSIHVADAPAEEVARITVGPDGRRVLRALEPRGWVHVNGAIVLDERVLADGDRIALGDVLFRYGETGEPEWDGRTRVESSAKWEPQWRRVEAPGRIAALDPERVVVVQDGTHARVLMADGAAWRTVSALAGVLERSWVLGDGSWVFGGPRLCVHLAADGSRIGLYNVPQAFVQVWGPTWQGAYGLSEAGLWRCDGRGWREVDLAGCRIGHRNDGTVRWNAGACDSRGRCWIVGANMRHGFLITADGDEWEIASSPGTGGLASVVCASDGTLFVTGFGMTRGLWPVGRADYRRTDVESETLQVRDDPRWARFAGCWRSIAGYSLQRILPVALAVYPRGSGPDAVVAVGREARYKRGRELLVFVDDGWRSMTLPDEFEHGRLDTTRDLRLTFVTTQGAWVSASLLAP